MRRIKMAAFSRLALTVFWLATFSFSVSSFAQERSSRRSANGVSDTKVVVPAESSNLEERSRVEEAKIREAIQGYVNAFNNKDAKALAAHWSPDGVYTHRGSGVQTVGREAMAKEFAAIFSAKASPKIQVTTESIQFISPSVALEKGTAVVKHSDESATETNYSVIFVKREGKWLIDRVTEDDVAIQKSNYDKLKDLEWMIGDWVDQDDDLKVETSCQWTKNQNYLSRIFKVYEDDEVVSSGLQIIGWDPSKKQIRSWLFDSSGGFVQGTWKTKDNRWMVQSVATMSDGEKGSFTAIFRPIDANSYGWQKTQRVVGGSLMPNIDEVIITRK